MNMPYWLKGGIIFSLIIAISILIRFLFGEDFSMIQFLIIVFAFIMGAIVGKIQEASSEWNSWLKFASRFASYTFLINILGLMWEGSLEILLVLTAPTYIIFIFAFMGNDNPSIMDFATIYSLILATSAVFWFIIGSIFGLVFGKLKENQ
ncbi:MAG: hypothetical protein ACI9AT_002392 [Ulvibacter sp.]|jgi:hypothetical protein